MDVANPLIKHSLVDTINAKRAIGVSDEQIAYLLNLAPTQVRRIPYPQPNVPRSRSVQHMQLQVMAQQLMPKVEAGDRDAMLTMLKVQQREANLLGLDAPKEVITHNFSSDKELENLSTAELKRRALEAIESGAIVEGELVTSPQAPDTARQGDQ